MIVEKWVTPLQLSTSNILSFDLELINMIIKHFLAATFGLSILCSFSFVENNTYYAHLNGLNTDNYKSIKLASLERDDITIESTCVPAGMIKFKFSGAISNAEDNLRSFLNENGEFQNIEFPENFTEENYFEKCSDARVGR